MRKMDYIVIAAALLLAAILFLRGWDQLSGEGAFAVIYQNGVEMNRVPLSEDQTISVGEAGNINVIQIQNGQVTMKEASCPDGVCVAHKPISKTRETIVCLPNKVYVEIEGAKEQNTIDAVAQ